MKSKQKHSTLVSLGLVIVQRKRRAISIWDKRFLSFYWSFNFCSLLLFLVWKLFSFQKKIKKIKVNRQRIMKKEPNERRKKNQQFRFKIQSHFRSNFSIIHFSWINSCCGILVNETTHNLCNMHIVIYVGSCINI